MKLTTLILGTTLVFGAAFAADPPATKPAETTPANPAPAVKKHHKNAKKQVKKTAPAEKTVTPATPQK